MQLLPIESQIVKYIAKYTELNWNRKNTGPIWTLAMKQALVKLGHRRGFKVYAAPQHKLKSN